MKWVSNQLKNIKKGALWVGEKHILKIKRVYMAQILNETDPAKAIGHLNCFLKNIWYFNILYEKKLRNNSFGYRLYMLYIIKYKRLF